MINATTLKVASLICFIVIVALTYTVFFPAFPAKKTKVINDGFESLKNKNRDLARLTKRRKRIDFISNELSKFPLFNLSNSQKEKFEYYVRRLDYKVYGLQATPADIHFIQTACSVLFVLVVVILSLKAKMFFALLALYPVVYSAYTMYLDSLVKKSDADIVAEFPAFFSFIYNQCKNLNIPVPHLAVMVDNYLPFAGEEMSYMLRRMMSHASSGEVFALKEIRREYPIKELIRFCTDISARIEGEDNVLNLFEFKKQLDDEEMVKIRASEAKKLIITGTANSTMYVIIIVAIALNFYGQFLFNDGSK